MPPIHPIQPRTRRILRTLALALLPFTLLLGWSSARAAEPADSVTAAVNESAIATRATVGIHVVKLETGETLYTNSGTRLFLPASNMKLFTSALALTRLGPDYRYRTQVVREPSGDLALIGSGDPSISGRLYPYNKDAGNGNPLAAMDTLAAQVAAAGVTRIDGNIVGDDRLYEWFPYPPSWTADDILYDYGAPVSALTFNDNSVTVSIRPGARVGDLARIGLTPRMEYFAIDNRVRTAPGSAARIEVARMPGSRQLLLRGTIGRDLSRTTKVVAVEDPALFAAAAFYDALQRQGIAIHGRPVARHRTSGTPASPPSGEMLAERISPPLSELLEAMEKVSQNLHAEMLLREVGRVRQGSATAEAGFAEMRLLLGDAGISLSSWKSEDASGLARNDEVSPQAMTQLLAYMWASEYRDAWISLLPIGGVDGTLESRLCCTSDSRLIQAKTGSLSRAITLSGYADNATHGRLAFSILVNNFADSGSSVRAWIDKIALALLK